MNIVGWAGGYIALHSKAGGWVYSRVGGWVAGRVIKLLVDGGMVAWQGNIDGRASR